MTVAETERAQPIYETRLSVGDVVLCCLAPVPSAAQLEDSSNFMQYREPSAAEAEDVLRIHRLAFERDEEADLVGALLRDPTTQPLLSLLADEDGRGVGHALFTAVGLNGLVGAESPVGCAILAPIAVLPSHQKSGLGRGLIGEGCRILAQRGVALVFVLGDPSYYGRFGFEAAVPVGLQAPYPIVPEEAWRVRALVSGVVGRVRGTVRPAEALAAEGLWRV